MATDRPRGDTQFEALPRRRLVILGGAGAGKTTLAMQLVIELSDPSRRRQGDPVPVLLPVAGWDPATHPELRDWLTVRLLEDYPSLRAFSPGVAAELVTGRHVLAVLDGLDELAEGAREEVLRALNASLTERDGLILTSRITAYDDAVDNRQALRGAAVIEPESLTPGDVATFLEGCLPRRPAPGWDDILALLRSNRPSPLASTFATPLYVWLFRKVFIDNHRDPSTLIDPDFFPTAASIRTHLLDELIPALLATRRPSRDRTAPFRPYRKHNPRDVAHWLGLLAHYLRKHRTRDFIWWHLPRNTLRPRVLALAVAIPIALLGGVTAGLTVGLRRGFGPELSTGLMSGVRAGVAFGLTYGLAVGLTSDAGAGGEAFPARV